MTQARSALLRRQIVSMIEQARRADPGTTLDGHSDTAARLASETIRLARLAASTHMILAARSIATSKPSPSSGVQKSAS